MRNYAPPGPYADFREATIKAATDFTDLKNIFPVVIREICDVFIFYALAGS
jgi:hypothetical protein